MFSKGYAEEIHAHFMETAARIGKTGEELLRRISEEEESLRPALEFLFASMPDSDIFDYPYEVYRDYALHGEKLWKEQEMGRRGWMRVPEKLFANYVLHHRANNEDLADDRAFFYEKLQDEIKGKDGGTYRYLNPGSVSIPKEGSAHSYMICENGTFIWKNLDGEEYMRWKTDSHS